MENLKCFNKRHSEIKAISICKECNAYMCNKCEIFHSELHQNHQLCKLDKNIDEIFTGFCIEKNHPNKLEFYCKNHNQLCCACCITKIATNEYGCHKDCNVCTIMDIKEEKKNKLKDNIKYLEDLSNNLNDKIKEIKNIFDKIDERKEELKSKIQNIVDKIYYCFSNYLKINLIFII